MEPLIVARVRRPHGVRGAVLVSVETDRPELVFQPGRKLRVGDERGVPTTQDLVIREVKQGSKGKVLHFKGIQNRDAVEELRRHTLLIDGDEVAPPAEDELHYRDLVGLEARTGEKVLGEVAEILDLHTGSFFVIRGGQRSELLVPIVPEFIAEVDPRGGFIHFDLPDGLLDL